MSWPNPVIACIVEKISLGGDTNVTLKNGSQTPSGASSASHGSISQSPCNDGL